MSQAVLDALQSRFPGAVLASHSHRGDETVRVAPARLAEILAWLKHDPDQRFELLLDVTAVDYSAWEATAPGRKPHGEEMSAAPLAGGAMGPPAGGRYEVVYHLASLSKRHRLRVKVVPEVAGGAPRLPTATHLWKTANWWERHVWDMMGVRFDGHPDLRRILLYEEFQGHPLRKDYPVNRRQPLIPERQVSDLVRGPGPFPRGRDLPMSQVAAGRGQIKADSYD